MIAVASAEALSIAIVAVIAMYILFIIAIA